MSRLPIIIIATFGVAWLSAAGHAATVTWTVTNSGEGHAVVIPADAKPQMDTIVAQAKTYLSANPGDTLVLYFPPGLYFFNNTNVPGIVFNTFTNGSLALSGAGTNATTLVFGQFDQIGIRIQNSRFITVQQLLLTRAGLYVTQGDVVSVQPGRVRLQVHPGFPDPVWLFNLGAAAAQERTLIGYAHENPLDPHLDPVYAKVLLSDIVSNGVGSVTVTNDDGSVSNVNVGQYDAMLLHTNELPPWPAGEWVALKCKTGAQTIKILASDDCVVQDVRLTQSSDNGLRAINGVNRMLVQRVTIDRSAPIYGRAPCFSSPAGGPQIYCGYAGATIQNCVVIGTADDGIGYFPDDSLPAITTNGVMVLPTNGVISGNLVRDNQARGIVIAASAGGICQGNTLVRNDDASILVENFKASVENYTNAAVRDWLIANNAFIEGWVGPVIKLHSQCTNTALHDQINIVSNSFIEATKNNNLVYVDNARTLGINNNTITSFSRTDDFTSNPLIGAISYSSPEATNALVYVNEGAWVSGTNTCLQPLFPTNRLVSVKAIATNVVNVSWNYIPAAGPKLAGLGVTNAGGNVHQVSVRVDLQPGNICRFWKSTNLGPDTWQDEGAVFATSASGSATWSETVTNQPAAFYRASW